MRPLLLLIVLTAFFVPTSAGAHAPEPRHEQLQVGPYTVDLGFSEWPIRAERSVDITFTPTDGIAGKTATVMLVSPNGEEWSQPLGRHPRQREIWGLDLIALPEAGPWTIGVTIDGPLGSGSGRLHGLTVSERPGPPAAPMWLLGLTPLAFLTWITVRAWRAVRPGTLPDVRAWT